MNFPGRVGVGGCGGWGWGGGVVGLSENMVTQPSLARAWAELGKNIRKKVIYIVKI